MPQTIYPTGTTIYDPRKCFRGLTVFQIRSVGDMLIDMNGRAVNQWKGLLGFPTPNKILPGGYIMGNTRARDPKQGFQDNVDLVQVDWDGNIVWKFNRYELVSDPGRRPAWMARQHHDYQREGNPVGYYAPGMEPLVDHGKTLVVCHRNVRNPDISDKLLLDDAIIEVDWDGNIIWEWKCSEHFNEFGFSEEARNALSRNPGMLPNVGPGMGDWMHVNSASWLGPNRRFDAGDARFHPENIILSGRETNILAIIDKAGGNIVWQVGPDYRATPALIKLGQIIGPHHVHMIPRGLPGEGNILVFDNGGWAGYGAPNPGSPAGRRNALRDYSRVIEFDPLTLEIVWQYPAQEARFGMPDLANRLYSALMSSAQRLPSGNTLITEGGSGRVFEVTPERETVWEYINPYYGKAAGRGGLYRAYRVPYEWVPQVQPAKEKAVRRIDNRRFRVPGSLPPSTGRTTPVKNVRGSVYPQQLCVLPED